MLVTPAPDPEAEAQNIIVNNVISCFHSNCNQNNGAGTKMVILKYQALMGIAQIGGLIQLQDVIILEKHS